MFRTYFLLPLLIPLVFFREPILAGLFRPFSRAVSWLAHNRIRAVLVIFALSTLLSAAITGIAGVPPPQTHDEFGYLLLGDTFAHGRLTNPAPPLWQHFETIHEIVQPTFTAKYPIGQGVALAIGQILGSPIIGVWLAAAAACAGICWMLFAWVPPRWAVIGGFIAVFHPLIIEWSQNYWGGAVATLGGALVIGGVRRVMNPAPRVRDSVIFGLGIIILANSRPYEGLIFCLLTGVAFVIWMIRARQLRFCRFFTHIAAPLACIMALLACQEGYYNWRVTGSPVVMPYMVHIQTYGIDPVFIFSKPRSEPVFRHKQIERLQKDYLAYYLYERKSWGTLFRATVDKLHDLIQGYSWSLLLLVPLSGLWWALRRDFTLRIAALIGVFFLAGLMFETWMHPHYAAPGASVFFLIVIASMRPVADFHWAGRRVGSNILRGLAILLAFSFAGTVCKVVSVDHTRWFYKRRALLEDLRRLPEKSLVIVHYEADHNPHREWVYNEADMASAKVILARDMGAENQELIQYYRDRKVWLLHPDAAEPYLEPYPG